jgi:hypothetical protein
MLLAIEKDIVAGKPLHQPSAPDGEVATLGTIGLIIDRIRGIPKVEALRRALLDWLENDDTFSIDKRDETFKRITAKVGASVDFIITGHTHLARAIPISEGHRFYYNCGTWTRLLGFSVSILKDQDRFESVFNILRSVSIEDIDDFALEVSKGERADLIRTWTTAVHVFVKQKEIHGKILEISEDPNDAIQMNPAKGTHFIRK